MQIKKIIFLVIICVIISSFNLGIASAKETGNAAFFATIGQPIGIAVLMPPEFTLVTTRIGLGMTWSQKFVIYGDLLFLPPRPSEVKYAEGEQMYLTYNFNAGVGVRFTGDKHKSFGIRFPLFFNWADYNEYLNKRIPLFTFEITPVLILIDETQLTLDGFVGIHLPF